MKDKFNREIEYMRISLTDRCNLRCKYCMPCDVPWIEHQQILSYEEILEICQIAVELGIDRFKITGGEPLVRKGCLEFIRTLKQMPGVKQVTMTTNGVLLRQYADELADAGVNGINVSLDTLDRDRFAFLTGKDALEQVLDGLYYAHELGIKMKVNCVPLKGFNEDGLLQMLEICRDYPIDVRFIEVMPIGYGKEYAGISVVNLEQEIRNAYPDGETVQRRLGNGPARYYHPYAFLGSVGFIDAIHGKFCSSCNRIRLTSEGFLKTCLYYGHGTSLRDYRREGGSREGLKNLMQQTIFQKPKEHHFGSLSADDEKELRKMSQIGG